MTESSVLHNTFFSTRLTTKHAFAFLSLKCIPSCRKTVDSVKHVKSTDWQISIHSQTLLFNSVIPVCLHWRKHYCIHFMMQKLFNANIQCFSVISCSRLSKARHRARGWDPTLTHSYTLSVTLALPITEWSHIHTDLVLKRMENLCGIPNQSKRWPTLCYFPWFWNKAFKQVFMKT